MKSLGFCRTLFLSIMLSIMTMVNADAAERLSVEAKMQNTPQFLYKILSAEDWKASQSQPTVKLAKDDAEFIHLSREDQIDRITAKYWSNVSEYVVLKIDTAKLPGNLVYEANPGGINKYYHLYDGSIPLNAVVESKIICS